VYDKCAHNKTVCVNTYGGFFCTEPAASSSSSAAASGGMIGGVVAGGLGLLLLLLVVLIVAARRRKKRAGDPKAHLPPTAVIVNPIFQDPDDDDEGASYNPMFAGAHASVDDLYQDLPIGEENGSDYDTLTTQRSDSFGPTGGYDAPASAGGARPIIHNPLYEEAEDGNGGYLAVGYDEETPAEESYLDLGADDGMGAVGAEGSYMDVRPLP
jgi:hypothetical protein